MDVVRKKKRLRTKAARACARGADVVVAVGGDGAVGEVIAAIARTSVSLAIVPAGTGNLLARNLGIPLGPADATRTIVEGERRTIDLGMISLRRREVTFAVASGIGFDADVMSATTAGAKHRWGRLAYLASALTKSATIRNVPHTIVLDGVEHRTDAAQVFVANCGRTIAGLSPRLPVRPDDGLLDVIVVQAANPLSALAAGWTALRQPKTGETPNGRVFRARARHIRIETDPRRRVEADGNAVGETPVEVSVSAGGLAVIVPAGRSEPTSLERASWDRDRGATSRG
jgi:YegS/Rv2252/BmrU family lipid kinase